HHAFSSGAGRTSDGNGSHASTLKSPSYTKSVSWQHYLRAYAHFVRWKHRDVEAPTKKTLFEFTRLAIVGRFLYLYLPEYCLF
ncbi:hypothetical protein AB9D85_15375, partial [Escherichia coli]